MHKQLILSSLLLVIFVSSCDFFRKNSTQDTLKDLAVKIKSKEKVTPAELDSIENSILHKKDSASLSAFYYWYAKYYQDNNKDAALTYRKKSIELARKLKNDTLLIDLHLLKSELSTDNIDVYLTSLLKADTLAKKMNDLGRNSLVQLKFGSFFYDRDQVKCEQYLDSAMAGFKELQDHENIALCLQNLASLENEKKDNPEKALELATESKDHWALINDSLNEAYMFQYMGILESKLNNLGKSKKNLLTAEKLFNQLSKAQEMAFCYYDLANVFEKQEQLDSSLFYLDKAKTIWELDNKPQSLFSVQNYMLKLYLTKKNNDKAFDFYSRNLLLEKEANIHWRDRMNFYQLSKHYYEQKNNKDMADLYAEEIKDLQTELSTRNKAPN